MVVVLGPEIKSRSDSTRNMVVRSLWLGTCRIWVRLMKREGKEGCVYVFGGRRVISVQCIVSSQSNELNFNLCTSIENI